MHFLLVSFLLVWSFQCWKKLNSPFICVFWLCANVSLLFNKFYSQHINICDKDHPPAVVQDALLSNFFFFLVCFGFVLLFSLGVLLVACCLTVQMQREVPPGPLSANNMLRKEFRFQRAHAEDHDISQLTLNLMFRNRIPLACGNINLEYLHSRFPLLSEWIGLPKAQLQSRKLSFPLFFPSSSLCVLICKRNLNL